MGYRETEDEEGEMRKKKCTIARIRVCVAIRIIVSLPGPLDKHALRLDRGARGQAYPGNP